MKRLFEIRHAIPGRIRFRVRPIRQNPGAAAETEKQVRAMTGVIWVRTNPACAGLIVGYNPAGVAEGALIQAIRRIFSPTTQVDKPGGACDTACACRDHIAATLPRSAALRFAGLSVVTGVVVVAENLLGVAIPGTLLSPLGIITTIAAVPLVLHGLGSIRQGRFTLESFLGATIVAAVAAGEAVAALEILWITSGAELLTAWMTERSRRAIRDILEITARNTYVLVDGVEVEVPVDQVRPGDLVVAHTGEKIAVDGVVVEGEALVDESPINGRAETSVRAKDDRVYAGTFVREGVIRIEAEAVGDRTYLSRILRMVEDSLENRAPVEGAAEALARRLIRFGFAATLATLAITASPWRAFTVMLVMACPCATVLAASTAVSAALSAAARRHILIKGGRYLEMVGRAEMICFDKTGTLTTTEPELREIAHVVGVTDDELVRLACTAERHNSHPIALAVRSEAERRHITPIPHDLCEYFLGRGVRAEIRGETVLIGNAKLMRRFDIPIAPVREAHEQFYEQGLTSVFIAREGKLLGVMGFANRNRPDALSTVRRLRSEGAEVAMITGDEKCSAIDLTTKLEIAECHYSVMPAEKADIVRALKSDGKMVLMVGDGINDAPALAEADVGIAMGAGGSEVAIEAADIALVTDDLSGVIYVRALSREAMRVVKQNFWIATGTNLTGVVLGAAGLLSPVMAGFFHIVHTVGILANSARLLRYEAPNLDASPAASEPGADDDAEVKVLNIEALRRAGGRARLAAK